MIFDLLKKREVRLNNIYGVNLHSTPFRTKKSPPKPNLYAFFITLGLALLKDNAKLCYIIPQTVLTAGDLDVLRYHLAKFYTIEKIVTFSGKMFIGRGLKQDRPVPTSSLILVVRRTQPHKQHHVDIINCEDTGTDIQTIIESIRTAKRTSKKTIGQMQLLENLTSWNFVTHKKVLLDLCTAYKKTTDGLSTYYEHALATHFFKSAFYFDIGYNIDEKNILDAPRESMDNYVYPKINEKYYSIREYKGYYPDTRTGTSKFRIKLLKNNQNYHLLDSDHRIVWSYMNFGKFHFSSIPIIWARNQICGIGSKNKRELLYLFAILNSPLTSRVLESNLRSANEKDFLLSIASVKEFVRVPKITAANLSIKSEIIQAVPEILALEEITLADLVDFSKVMMQKFDAVSVKGNSLILCKDKKETKLEIKSNEALVKRTIAEKYRTERLEFEGGTIRLSELKSLPAIDFKRQAALKDYIDDMVFSLYFGIPLKKLGMAQAPAIRKLCEENKFYKLLKKA